MIGKIVFIISLCVCLSANMYADNKNSVGKPNRSANFDALPGFKNPPKGYGEVPFYWWMGDTLTKEHLTGHLEILKDKGISSLQVNYAHSDKGGKLWGLTYKSKPEIFTEDRGLIYGCDHGGRGLDVAEFGDYFRTQRWNQGPGCDQPDLQKNIIKNKVASSIAHINQQSGPW